MGYLDLFAQYLVVDTNYSIGRVSVWIAGGAALALKYSLRGTVDIDADISFAGDVNKSIRKVARKCRLETDWLNQSFTTIATFSRRLWEDSIYYTTLQGYLDVYLVSDLTQLCMKLIAGREKDLSDISYLTQCCYNQGISYEAVLYRFKYLYSGCNPKERAAKYCYAMYYRLTQGLSV